MKKTMAITLLCAFMLSCTGLLQAAEHGARFSDYLAGRIDKSNDRYSSFLLVLELLKHRQAKTLVETGTARDGDLNFFGDGGSTVIFGDFASQNNANLSTVDISPVAIEKAANSTQKYNGYIDFTCSDSIAFLKEFNKPIDFLYLDSFDFDFSNPLPSQEHHLKEIIAAYPKLHKDSIVMIDDCGLIDGGKGKLIIQFLLAKGWTIIYDGYQVILVQ